MAHGSCESNPPVSLRRIAQATRSHPSRSPSSPWPVAFPGAADVEEFWHNLCEGRDSITMFGTGRARSGDPRRRTRRSGVRAGARRHRRRRAVRRRILRHQPARSRADGSAAADLPGAGLGMPGARRPRARCDAGAGRCVRRHVQRHLLPAPCLGASGPGRQGRRVPGDAGQREGLHRHPRRAQAQPDRPGDQRAYRLFDLAGGDLPGGGQPARSAIATWRWPAAWPSPARRAAATSTRRARCCRPTATPAPSTRRRRARCSATARRSCCSSACRMRIADGNQVLAVIRGGAVNNDGGGKASFTAPSSEGQAAVIAMAQADAEVEPRSIGYVEAHGTATPMGDPIEIEGLTQGLPARHRRHRLLPDRFGQEQRRPPGDRRRRRGRDQDRAGAGRAADSRQPAFPDAQSGDRFRRIAIRGQRGLERLAVATAQPRRAGVSSFGVGGTNAHVVLEEAPALPASGTGQWPATAGAVRAHAGGARAIAPMRLAGHLETHPRREPGRRGMDAGGRTQGIRPSHRAGRRRQHRCGRRSCAVRGRRRAPRAAGRHGRATWCSCSRGRARQYAGMGRGLYDDRARVPRGLRRMRRRAARRNSASTCASARSADDRRSAAADRGHAAGDVRDRICAGARVDEPRRGAGGDDRPQRRANSWPPRWPACSPCPMRCGWWRARRADAGAARRWHVVGAAAAGRPAGAHARRSCRWRRRTPRATAWWPDRCEAIARFQAQLEAEGVACRALRTSHAFHSQMMEPVVAPFRAEVAALTLSAPSLPLVSTATGDWLDADAATSPDYWARHLREPVRFAAALERVLDEPARVLLEVGPRATLCSACAPASGGAAAAASRRVASLADTPASGDIQLPPGGRAAVVPWRGARPGQLRPSRRGAGACCCPRIRSSANASGWRPSRDRANVVSASASARVLGDSACRSLRLEDAARQPRSAVGKPMQDRRARLVAAAARIFSRTSPGSIWQRSTTQQLHGARPGQPDADPGRAAAAEDIPGQGQLPPADGRVREPRTPRRDAGCAVAAGTLAAPPAHAAAPSPAPPQAGAPFRSRSAACRTAGAPVPRTADAASATAACRAVRDGGRAACATPAPTPHAHAARPRPRQPSGDTCR